MGDMKLQALFSGFEGLSSQAPNFEVQGICSDARLAKPGFVFVAIPGSRADGHDFIPQALQAGALVLVVQDARKIPKSFSGLVLKTQNSREALDKLASRFYSEPGNDMFCFGVTGTNGKTSTTYMVEHMLGQGSLPTGVIGTIDHHLGSQVWPSDMTTPDPIRLQERLGQFRDAGAKAVAMEVSSHALDQFRADSVPFDCVAFTNLTRDHLDYHGSMENYFLAKERLFFDLLAKSTKSERTAIINSDDEWGGKIRLPQGVRKWTYGVSAQADFQFEIKNMNFLETQFVLNSPFGKQDFVLPMSGVHNVQNSMIAIATALCAGLSWKMLPQYLLSFKGVPGRLQGVVNSKSKNVFVDYAHTPDALDNVLQALNQVKKALNSSAKIWTIFGCGGDRDKGKRPLMAQSALKGSDRVVITSDNPRSEDPMQIIEEIKQGVSSSDFSRVHIEVDRRKAIEWALGNAPAGDVILIAGKGHEDYQIIGSTKQAFSDYLVAQEFLEK